MAKKPPLKTPEVAPAPPAVKIALAFVSIVWMWIVLLRFDVKFQFSIRGALAFLQDISQFSFSMYATIAVSHLKSIAVFLFLIVSITLTGRFFIKDSDGVNDDSIEKNVLSIGIGSVLISYITLFFGFLNLYAILVPIYFLAGVVIIFIQRRYLLHFWQGNGFRKVAGFFVSSPLHFLLLPFLLLPLLMGFVPEIFYDSLVYHVGLPQLYVNSGGLVDTPYVYFSRFPLMIHMLYVVGIAFDGPTLAKFLNAAVTFAGGGAVYCLCSRWGTVKAGVLGTLVILSIPVVQMNIWSTPIDSAMGSFFLLSVLAFMRWKGNGFRSKWDFAVFCVLGGSVFAIKYTGVVSAMGIGLMLLSTARYRPVKTVLIEAVCYALIVTALMTPWFVRNYVRTGNPVYPIMYKHFESRHLNAFQIDNETKAIRGYTPKNIFDCIKLPWTLTMHELNSFNFIGPLTLSLFPFLLFLDWKKPDLVEWGVLILVYFGISLIFTREIRYLLPGLFLIGTLGAVGAASAVPVLRGFGFVFNLSFAFQVLYLLGWILGIAEASYTPGAVVTGRETRLSYISRYHQGLNPWPWNAIEPELANLPKESKIYIFGDEKAFGSPRRVVYSSVHDYTPLVDWANEAVSGAELLARVQREGVTHILFNYPESARLKDYQLFHWNDQGRKNFLDFSQNHLKYVASRKVETAPNAVMLFQVVDSFGPNDSHFPLEPIIKQIYNLGS